MNHQEFLEWEENQELPFEFANGLACPLDPSSQQRSLLITDIICEAKKAVRVSPVRVLSRMRILLPGVQEVRYLDVVLDAGHYSADALEPADPILIIDVGRCRDFSMLEAVVYLSVQPGADAADVAEEIRAVLHPNGT